MAALEAINKELKRVSAELRNVQESVSRFDPAKFREMEQCILSIFDKQVHIAEQIAQNPEAIRELVGLVEATAMAEDAFMTPEGALSGT